MKRLVGLATVLSASLFLGLGCAPPANQAPANAAVSSGAPPAPPPAPPTSALEPGEAPTSAAVPPSEAPTAETPPAGLSAFSPLGAYEDLDKRINAVLHKVTDGPSANAAADELTLLTDELKLTLRPYLAALAAMPDAARDRYLQQKTQEAISQKTSGNEVDHQALIDLARQPGNERFKAALQSMFQTMNDEGSTGIRRSATRLMERLNRP